MSVHARSSFLPAGISTVALDVQAGIMLHQVLQLADCDDYHAWLAQLIAPYSGRRYVDAQHTLFDAKDPARYYYLVVAGEFLVQRRTAANAKPVIRMMRRGDFFSYDCGGQHAASCYATQDSIVLPIARSWLDNLAEHNAALADLIKCAHSTELEMILQSLRAASDDANSCQQPREDAGWWRVDSETYECMAMADVA